MGGTAAGTESESTSGAGHGQVAGCGNLSFLLPPPHPDRENVSPGVVSHNQGISMPTHPDLPDCHLPAYGAATLLPHGVITQRRGRFSSSHRRTTGHQWHGLGDRIFLIGSPKLLPSPVPTARTTDQHLLNYWRLILQSSSAHRDLVPLMRPPNPVC